MRDDCSSRASGGPRGRRVAAHRRLRPHVRNRGIRRRAAGPGRRDRGPAPPGVPRLRLRRHRAGRHRDGVLIASDKRAGQARQPREGDRGVPAAAVDDRHRAHPLGHPRRPERRQRPPAPRARAPGRGGAQRHHRELRPAARRARARRATTCSPRPTPRSPRTCSRTRSLAGPDLTTAMQNVCRRLEGAFTLVAVDGQDPSPRRRRPPQLPAGRRHRRGRELHRLRRRRVHRAHPRGARARPGPGRHDHPRRRRGHRLRRQPRRGPALPRRLGPRRRREGRLRLVHAQGDLRAAARGRRRAARPPRRGRPAPARRGPDQRRRAARRSTRSSSSAAAPPNYAGHGREVRHRALDPDPVRGRARPRVPLPRPDPDPQHPGRRDQPVRRDRRHPDGDPARAQAEGQGARDLQHQRLDDPARVRRGDLHPRRARRSASPRPRASSPSWSPATCSGSTSRRCAARSSATRSPPSSTSSAQMPGHVQRVLDDAERDLRARASGSSDTRSVLFLGRHAGFPVALEGALKLKELAYIHAEGFAAGELKHGPIALIEEGLPVFCVVPPARSRPAARQDDQRDPGDPRPRCAHDRARRGGRRRGRRRTPTC